MKISKNEPKPPTCLSPKAAGIWKAVLEEYDLEVEMVETLRVALENLDLADRARALLRQDGFTVEGKKNPASDAVKLHDGLYLRAIRQLGLDHVTPGSN